MEYKMKALTNIWTGDAKMEGSRLINTGLLGSIRWWLEVLVRGLGGKACDPTGDSRCPDHKAKKATDPKHHCVVCELFGCTGWGRKFRFEVLDENGQIKKDQIKGGKSFGFRFTPLRYIQAEEWVLLDATIKLIASCGAMGGKIGYKPSDENDRKNKPHHKDYGLVQLNQSLVMSKNTNELKKYVALDKWEQVDHNNFTWSSLQHFWCVNGKYLARQNSNASTFNRVISRPEPKQQSSNNDSWIAGRRPNPRNNIAAESKKVFSFKIPPRTIGFVPNPKEFSSMKQGLEKVWGNGNWKFLAGDELMNQLFAGKEAQR